jgi:hypothetical protein
LKTVSEARSAEHVHVCFGLLTKERIYSGEARSAEHLAARSAAFLPVLVLLNKKFLFNFFDSKKTANFTFETEISRTLSIYITDRFIVLYYWDAR